VEKDGPEFVSGWPHFEQNVQSFMILIGAGFTFWLSGRIEHIKSRKALSFGYLSE